jgi:hypothetical protein
MAISSTSTTKQALFPLALNCSPLKHHLPNDPLPLLDHELMPSPIDQMIHAQAMAQDQTVRHHGDETTITGMMWLTAHMASTMIGWIQMTGKMADEEEVSTATP